MPGYLYFCNTNKLQKQGFIHYYEIKNLVCSSLRYAIPEVKGTKQIFDYCFDDNDNNNLRDDGVTVCMKNFGGKDMAMNLQKH